MDSNTERPGLFITFEGIDGSGKSTQLTLCAQALEARGVPVLVTRNPGGTELGQEIRNIVLHHTGFVDPTCELMLYMADRAQHMQEVVIPALQAGKVVLCDRHLDSTVAYQGYGRGLDLALIDSLNQIATQGRLPDQTFLFDGPPEVLATRVSKRGQEDRLEKEALPFRDRVRQGFLEQTRQHASRIQVFNALMSADELHHEVMKQLPQY